PGLHCRFFGAEPTLGFCASIAAAAREVIDAGIGPGTKGIVSFDFASLRHDRLFRKELVARIRRADGAEQLGRMFAPPAKILGADDASLPHPGECSTRVFLVDSKAALGVRLQIERPPLAHQPMAKIDARNGALSNPSFWVGRIGANIRTFDRPP